MAVPATAQVEQQVDAPPSAVFAVLADPWSYAGWVAGTRAVRGADARWPEVGSRLWHRFGNWPLRSRDFTEVLECEPPHRLVLCAHVRPLGVVRAVLTVVADGDGSLVRIREDTVDGLIRRFGPLTAWVQRRRNTRSLRLLARAVDRSPSAR